MVIDPFYIDRELRAMQERGFFSQLQRAPYEEEKILARHTVKGFCHQEDIPVKENKLLLLL